MIVCLCLGVSDSTVRTLVAAGADSAEAVARACGAGTDCGSCLGLLGAFVDDGPWEASTPARAERALATASAR
jgi:bacterioferritin-associated ferredoxin